MNLHRFAAFLRILLILVILGAALPAAQGARADTPAPTVLADAGDAVALEWLASSGAQLLADYGAFSLWRLSAMPADRLSQKPASLQPTSQTIFLRDLQLQTDQKEPEPRMPAALQQVLALPGVSQFWMVQFAGPIRDEWLQQLTDSGLQIVAYLPDNAYVVWGQQPDATLDALTGLESVIGWQGAYHPYYRLSPELRPGAVPAPSGDLDVTVQVYSTPELKSTLASLEKLALAAYGAPQSVLNLTNIRLRLPAASLEEVASLNDVFNVEQYIRPALTDEAQTQILAGNVTTSGGNLVPTGPGYLSWLGSLGFPSTPSSYPIVDVTDDGIDQGNPSSVLHPDFHELGAGASPDRIIYINNCTSNPTGNAVGGHGNLNLGIVGGYNNSTGSAYEDASGYQYGLGVSPYGRLAGTKIFNNSGSWDDTACGGSISTMVSNSYTSGARITNNSWGANVGGAYNADSQIYDVLTRDATAAAGNQQMLHVFSAGNAGSGSNTIGSPGTAKNVLTVGAGENVRAEGVLDGCSISAANNANDMATYSSRGPTDDARAKPELVAPGSHVTGPASQDPGYDGSGVCDQYYPNGQTRYAMSTGTSHSAPAVAGAAQLVYEYYGRVWVPGSTPSPAMLKALLISSPSYMNGAGANDTLPGVGQGWGLVNLGSLFDATPRQLVDQSHTFDSSGQTTSISGTIANNSKPFRVTLAWTDPPGATTGNSYVNDLNLEVIVNGITYKGNVFSGATSTTGGVADPRNNVENVFLPAGVVGSFQVNVIASNIAGDGVPGSGDATDQDFALVIYNTGALTTPMLYKSATRWIEAYGNADGNIQTGEVWDLEVDLNNVQSAPTASGVSAVLTTSSSGLQLLQDTAAYNDIPGGGMQTNLARYRMRVLHSLGCASAPLNLAVTYTGGSTGITLDPLTPTPVSSSSQTYTSTAVPAAIPDNNPSGVLVPVTVGAGIVGDINVNLSLTHTYDSDLAISLQGPGGATTVSLAYRRGSSGDNYTNTTFDDEAATPIGSGSAPFTGSFRPDATLSAFDGLAAAGTWNLKVVDMAGIDTGNVTAFNLTVTTVSCTLSDSTTYNYLPTIWR